MAWVFAKFHMDWDSIFDSEDPNEPQTTKNFLKISNVDGPEREPHTLPELNGQTLANANKTD